MIEKRLVQWYAADAGIDLDIAEREIILAYVLRILADEGLLDQLAFKGGTAIRKLHLGGVGRFSLDLDFTALKDTEPDNLVLDLVGVLHEQTHYGLTFIVPGADYYATADSCGAEVTYQHDWVTAGRLGVQVSFRAPPLLPVRPARLLRERYFDWMEVQPPTVPALDLHNGKDGFPLGAEAEQEFRVGRSQVPKSRRPLVTATTTSRPITRNSASCIPLQMRVGDLS